VSLSEKIKPLGSSEERITGSDPKYAGSISWRLSCLGSLQAKAIKMGGGWEGKGERGVAGGRLVSRSWPNVVPSTRRLSRHSGEGALWGQGALHSKTIDFLLKGKYQAKVKFQKQKKHQALSRVKNLPKTPVLYRRDKNKRLKIREQSSQNEETPGKNSARHRKVRTISSI